MALNDITSEAVLAAIAEFDRLGREEFLSRYGFGPARRYLLVYRGAEYDSKAIAGAAHGYLPGRQPLTAAEFSGGVAAAVGVLRRLGFDVTDQGLSPAITGDELVTAIAGLQYATASGKPMLKQPVVLLWAIGRAHRGEDRLLGWEETARTLTALLEKHRRVGERPRPDYPIAALFHAGLWELTGHTDPIPRAHGDSILETRLRTHKPQGGLPVAVHDLVRRSGLARLQVIDALIGRFFDDFDYSELLIDVGLVDDDVTADEPDNVPAPPVNPKDAYARWCAMVVGREDETYSKRRTSTTHDPIRIAAARRAVILRSEGRCENPACGLPSPDLTDRGEPILEVDHVNDLAGGGRDHPVQMIALCPNCHAVKTRGRRREQLRATLLTTAHERHERWINSPHV
jgi:5-methylcytosine-specific restriction protein A